MIFQKVLCVGDSQTFGARSKAGYPEYMVEELRSRTKIEWVCVNEGVNNETVLQILRRTDRVVRHYDDVFMVCVLAGTNDARSDVLTPIELFKLLYRQLIVRYLVEKKIVFPATIPIPVKGFGHLPYSSDSVSKAHEINCAITEVVSELGLMSSLVRLDETEVLTKTCFVDSVHFNDEGCKVVARLFADKIMARSA